MHIPIQNIYYLLCYAWNKLDEGDVVTVQSIKSPEMVDLFARVLIGGTTHLMKRGLDRGYVLHNEDRNTLRGKIDFNASLKRNLLTQGKAHCHFDELHYNILHNQILKSTIRHLILVKKLNPEYKENLIGIYRRLHGINEITLSKNAFRSVQLNRNNYFYDFLLKVCELIFENLYVTESNGEYKFKDFTREPSQMRILFESFVRNFFKLELEGCSVGREDIQWQAEELIPGAKQLLPKMQTDISIETRDRKIIIDTKFSHTAFQSNRDFKQSLKSLYLYQLFAYLINIESKGGLNCNCEGILLYPTVEKELDLIYEIQGHKVSIKTINLNQPWQGIHKDLLSIIDK